jgi:heat shock protein HslJ
MLLRIATMLAVAMALAVEANAAVPPFAAECGPDLNVQADARGAVRINGKVARLIPRPDGQTTAVGGGVYIDITPQGREPARVTYTARDKSVGTCEVVSFREHDGAVAPQRPLADTRWRLVEFLSMNDAQGKTRPHDPAAYTMHLRADGSVKMQLNCNRAQGTWSARPAADGSSGGFEFGPLATTRALCPPPSMDEIIAAQARLVRGYLLKDGNLFLSLMADGGIFARAPGPTVAGSAPVRPAWPAEGGPRDWQVAGSGSPAALQETPSASGRVWRAARFSTTWLPNGREDRRPGLVRRAAAGRRAAGLPACGPPRAGDRPRRHRADRRGRLGAARRAGPLRCDRQAAVYQAAEPAALALRLRRRPRRRRLCHRRRHGAIRDSPSGGAGAMTPRRSRHAACGSP